MPNAQLSWQPGFSLSRKPARRSAARRTKRGASGNADKPQQFEFIAERPMRNYETGYSPSIATSTHSRAPVAPTTERQTSSNRNGTSASLAKFPKIRHSIVSKEGGAHSQVEAVEETGPFIEKLLLASSNTSLIRSCKSPNSETSYETNEPSLYQWNSEGGGCVSVPSTVSKTDKPLQIFEGSNVGFGPCDETLTQVAIEPSLAAVSALSNTSCSPSASMPPSMLYSSVSHRFRPILDRYNREFCKIPLTSEIQINPFRYRIDLDPEPIFLVHAVMALAGHHVESTLTQNHRHTALQLLRKSLNTIANGGYGYSMLDAIIILFSLDETQSALGNWSTHLVGAYGILEACGGIEGWATSARVVAQVGMLTWWDAIMSLLSREDCVFPYAYFEAVLSNQNDQEWDFFGLCGCPPSLVKIVMQLARLSAEKRKSSSMRYVSFDTTVVSEIEQSLESWHHVSPMTAFRSEECMQQDQDKMHCSEAWRNGFLLYIYRVFHWEPGSSIPMHILYRARVIVDHVFACRDESMVARQALLPLFFAGCELKDPSLRKKILTFCSIWSERTRYHMFSSTIPLLEQVWAGQERKGFENVWWGQVVDKQHSSDSRNPLPMRICFG